MINFQPQKPVQTNSSHIPLSPGARKVFEEASGVSDSFIPELGDHYEDLAADFLEKWLVSSDSEPSASSPAPAAPVATPEKAPEKALTPSLTSFSLDLDWQLADGRKF